MIQWGHIAIVYEQPFISDHAPISLSFNEAQRNRRVPFKFFNVWVVHERFLQEV